MNAVLPQPVAPWTFRVTLRCGTLTLRVDDAEMPLEELCTFGTRRNPKRGFLIVSKVLGKHVPARPSVMNRVHAALAGKLQNLDGPVLFIALAETAIGLGQGTFEAWLRASPRDDAVFLHSTRYRLDRPLAGVFREGHSHATEHLLYLPRDPAAAELFRQARTLVLIDDEMSTGRTLAGLAHEIAKSRPRLEAVHFVSITDWLDDGRRREIETGLAEAVAVIRFHHLLCGQLDFEPNDRFDPGPLPDVAGNGRPKDGVVKLDHGRLGVRHDLTVDNEQLLIAAGLAGGERVLVLGTGEFVHAPYLLARCLEERGWDVLFQSTTRSPVLVGEGIASAVEFVDNYHDEMPNYVYNVADRVADRRYDRVLICYETQPLPASHRLPEMLGAQALFP
jgi:hypothetical protein